MPKRTIKLTMEYDGSDFVGWQSQENGRSVQTAVESALRQILQEPIRIVGAGRTDSGVHAKGQVASFETENLLSCSLIARGLNGVLPDDIVVLKTVEVAPGFNARYSALSRRYQYVIARNPVAIWRKYSWYVGYELDIELMNRCASEISGMHDFTSYCKSEANVNHHRCTVHRASWIGIDGTTLVFDITADRFLHGMVRALVGTMVDVGRGFRTLQEFSAILETRDRTKAGMSAPARGLFLTEVTY